MRAVVQTLGGVLKRGIKGDIRILDYGSCQRKGLLLRMLGPNKGRRVSDLQHVQKQWRRLV